MNCGKKKKIAAGSSGASKGAVPRHRRKEISPSSLNKSDAGSTSKRTVCSSSTASSSGASKGAVLPHRREISPSSSDEPDTASISTRALCGSSTESLSDFLLDEISLKSVDDEEQKYIGSTASSFTAPWGNPQKIASNGAARDILDRMQEQLLKLADLMYPDPTLDSETNVDVDKLTEIILAITEKIMESVREYPTGEISSIERMSLLNEIIDDVINSQLTLSEMKLFLHYLEESVEDYCLHFTELLNESQSGVTSPRPVTTQTDLIPPSPASECGDSMSTSDVISCYLTEDERSNSPSEISVHITYKETLAQKEIKSRLTPAQLYQFDDNDDNGPFHHDSNEPGTSKEGDTLSEKTVPSSEGIIDNWEDFLEEQSVLFDSIISNTSTVGVAASTQSSESDFDRYLKDLPTTYIKIARDQHLYTIEEELKEDVSDSDSHITFFSTTEN